jgi:hypothetical protein
MADLDARTARALCRAMARVLTVELRERVTCRDISRRNERWDLEAVDAEDRVARRVSHTRAVPEDRAMAGAELRDVIAVLESELVARRLGLRLHGRQFPTSRQKRKQLARHLAERVVAHVATGAPIIKDPIQEVLAGRHPYSDPIAAAFVDVEVSRRRAGRTTKVMAAGDDRWMSRVPELHEEILPYIARKAIRHQELTSSLTLVVEPVLSAASRASIVETVSHLGPEHRGFLSVYVGRASGDRFPLRRLY